MGTNSQYTSTLRSPRLVWSVTDIACVQSRQHTHTHTHTHENDKDNEDPGGDFRAKTCAENKEIERDFGMGPWVG